MFICLLGWFWVSPWSFFQLAYWCYIMFYWSTWTHCWLPYVRCHFHFQKNCPHDSLLPNLINQVLALFSYTPNLYGERVMKYSLLLIYWPQLALVNCWYLNIWFSFKSPIKKNRRGWDYTSGGSSCSTRVHYGGDKSLKFNFILNIQFFIFIIIPCFCFGFEFMFLFGFHYLCFFLVQVISFVF